MGGLSGWLVSAMRPRKGPPARSQRQERLFSGCAPCSVCRTPLYWVDIPWSLIPIKCHKCRAPIAPKEEVTVSKFNVGDRVRAEGFFGDGVITAVYQLPTDGYRDKNVYSVDSSYRLYPEEQVTLLRKPPTRVTVEVDDPEALKKALATISGARIVE